MNLARLTCLPIAFATFALVSSAAFGGNLVSKTLKFSDVAGKVYTAADLSSAKVSVFLFVSHNCPVANAYTPRIIRFAKAYAPKGVKTFAVYADCLETVDDVRDDSKGRGYDFFPVVKDHHNLLTDALGAVGMPEAVVVDHNLVIQYRGRIDDNQVTTRVIKHDLVDVVNALLAGKPSPESRTATFGCTLRREPGTASRNAGPTYASNVAPILRSRCETCHRPGEIGPFPLQTYKTAAAWAGDIKTYTTNGLMPPLAYLRPVGASASVT